MGNHSSNAHPYGVIENVSLMTIKRMKFIGFPVFLLLFLTASALQAGPKIQSWNTANGAKVLFVPAADLPMLDIRVVFDAGSARDADKPGLAVLTNALLTDGAAEWDADQIAERLEAVGAEMDAGALRDMAWVSLRTLTEKRILSTSLETLVATLASPRFGQGDLERSRQAMQVSLRRLEQSPGKVASKAFYAALYGEHPYASYRGGTQASLAGFTRDDVVAYFQRYYVARNASIAIVGAVSRVEAEKLAEDITRRMPAGEHAPDLSRVADLAAATDIHTQFPSTQTHILMGQPGVFRGDKDYFTLYVGNHILGGSGLISQLSEEVREKRGLSYSVYSYFSPMRRKGPFVIGGQTQNAKAVEALEVMRATLKRYIKQGPTEDELTASKQNITGGFPLRIASNSNIVEYLAMLGFYDMPLDYLDTFVSRINAVTGEQIKEAFQRRLDMDRFVTVVVGNGQTAEKNN